MAVKKSRSLQGGAPDKSPWALLLIDVINDMNFPGGDKLLKHALPAAKKIATLKKRAASQGVPVIYVNDNFGRWKSDFRALVKHCLHQDARGAPVTQLLRPEEPDYFVLKPKHSGFFSSSLEILLKHLGSTKLVLTGFAGNICVLYTANDAYMRDYDLIVPSDGIASEDPPDNQRALDHMKRHLKARVCQSRQITFKD
jgi:nicotinamidase-related amidase